MRKRLQIGVLAILLTAGASQTTAGARLVSSARNFGRQYHALRSANISPIERLVLSLAMTS